MEYPEPKIGPEFKIPSTDEKQASVLRMSRKFFDDLSHGSSQRYKPVNKTEAIIEAVYGPHWQRKLIRSSLETPAPSDKEEAKKRK